MLSIYGNKDSVIFKANFLINIQPYLECKKIASLYRKYNEKCIDRNRFHLDHSLIKSNKSR